MSASAAITNLADMVRAASLAKAAPTRPAFGRPPQSELRLPRPHASRTLAGEGKEKAPSTLPRSHVSEQKSRHLAHLDFLAAFGDAVAAVMAIDMLERLVP